MACGCAQKDTRLEELKTFIQGVKQKERVESYLIAVLHKAQGLYGYLSAEVMDAIAAEMGIPTAHIWGVATFYHFFNLTPKGKHTISVCLGTACYVKGAEEILRAVKDELKIDIGQTTADAFFSLQETRCLGACGLAPVMMIDEKIYGDLTPQKVQEILRSYKR